MWSTRSIWIGSGVIFTSLLTFKQVLWFHIQNQIVENREKDNAIASDHLRQVEERAKQFYLEPLSKDDLERLMKIKGSEYDEILSLSKPPVVNTIGRIDNTDCKDCQSKHC